jgi:TM2 domain-containing membrane protein YozV
MASPYETPDSNLENTASMRPCIGCGKELHVTASTCPHCGASQRKRGYKSKVSAAVLAFFLGGFGIHRFYLGQWWGVFYLLFFWTMIPGLIAFIEFIIFLVMDQQDWDRKHNEAKPAGPNESGGGAALVLLVVVGIFIVISVIGILAAIAIPQYHDYTQRAQVAGAVVQLNPVKQGIEDFYLKHNTLPDSNIMMGLKEPHLLEGNHEVKVFAEGFELILSGPEGGLGSKTIVYIPYLSDGNIAWDCTSGTLEARYRPADCRN